MTDTSIKETAAAKADEWAERIAAQQRGGTSVEQFCKEQGLTEYCFYTWRKRLQKNEPIRFAFGITMLRQGQGKESHYTAAGEWNRLGGYAENLCSPEKRVRMVAGGSTKSLLSVPDCIESGARRPEIIGHPESRPKAPVSKCVIQDRGQRRYLCLPPECKD